MGEGDLAHPACRGSSMTSVGSAQALGAREFHLRDALASRANPCLKNFDSSAMQGHSFYAAHDPLASWGLSVEPDEPATVQNDRMARDP